MRVNLDLSFVQTNDTIIVANNRQVLAIKQSIYELNGSIKMPQIFSYRSWLEHFWKKNNPQRTIRLLSLLELRYILKEITEKNSINNSEVIIDELIKCYSLCKTYFIDISTLPDFYANPSSLLIKWISEFEKFKTENNCIDTTDLFSSVYKSLESNIKIGNYYAYGFKQRTPEQNKLFEILKCQSLNSRSLENNIQALSFIDQETELESIAKWAKEVSLKNPNSQIGVVIPNLSQLQHLVKSTFDQEFDASLLETHHKPYNISLGMSLCQYPLIQHLLSIVKISSQIIKGNIELEMLMKTVTSPYIKGALNESNSRALLVNRILGLGCEEATTQKVLKLMKDCPVLIQIVNALRSLKIDKKIALEDSLDSINLLLLTWGFTSDRSLSSSEYQLFEKYQNESLILNRLSNFYKKVSLFDAIKILNTHLNSVIFQPKSGTANIHILGALEAEGLYFDHAWVSSMTSNFIPGKIKMPLFIPQKTSIEYKLPNSNFLLVTEDAKVTLKALNNLSPETTYSYAKLMQNREELPSPYIDFKDYLEVSFIKNSSRELIYIDDYKAPKIQELTIKKGVKTLQNQMSCPFRGFAGRLDIDDFEAPHIGLSRLQQGNLIHKILETFFNEIKSSASLLKLTELELDNLIEKHTESATQNLPKSNFKLNEKIRLVKIIRQHIDLEKKRSDFEVIKTESTSEVNINGLKFSTRIDRMDRLANGDSLIIDYKTGKDVKVSQMTGDPIDQAQLPIYAVTNSVDGVAFATINSNDCQFKAITKNKSELPLTKQAINRMPEWDKQITEWTSILNSASKQFQNGIASVLPVKNACDYCDYDLLCRVKKSSNN
ncbi:MAG: PD-(D/E)XK nuclease family protein [Candidatus Pseudothioglobus sp.]